MIEIKNVDKYYFSKTLFKNLTLSIPSQTIAWIVGINGSGKTTLLKMILWEISPDHGEIIFPHKNMQIWYMKQEIQKDFFDEYVFDYIKKELWIFELEQELRSLENNLSEPENFEKYSQIYELFEAKWWYAFEYEIQNILWELHFWWDFYAQKIWELSWGQKSKILLSLALWKGKDLILLDEPTNNLDIQSLKYLITYIKKSWASFLIISHDRDFLDEICNKIYECDTFEHTVIEYEWNYSFYLQKKKEKFEQEMLEYELSKQKMKEFKEARQEAKQRVERTKNSKKRDNDKFQYNFFLEAVTKWYGSKVHQFSQKITELSQTQKPQTLKKIHYQLSESSLNGYIRVQDVEFQYEKSNVKLNIPRFEANMWERIGIFWANGSWKSTFLHLLNRKIFPNRWEIVLSGNIKIGNFSQEHSELFWEESPIELLIKKWNISEMEAHKLLWIFHFEIEDRNKSISLLSPWQRVKLIFTLFQLQNFNTLILDEPSNHLDLEALEVLENALQDFRWIFIVVSHDKKFIQNISLNKFYDVKDWVLIERIGD